MGTTARFSGRSHQIADRTRRNHPPFSAIGLVVHFNIGETVKIVDHDSCGLLETLIGGVA